MYTDMEIDRERVCERDLKSVWLQAAGPALQLQALLCKRPCSEFIKLSARSKNEPKGSQRPPKPPCAKSWPSWLSLKVLGHYLTYFWDPGKAPSK